MQEQAIRKTSERLAQLGLLNAELILAGHEAVDQYVTEPVRAAILTLVICPAQINLLLPYQIPHSKLYQNY